MYMATLPFSNEALDLYLLHVRNDVSSQKFSNMNWYWSPAVVLAKSAIMLVNYSWPWCQQIIILVNQQQTKFSPVRRRFDIQLNEKFSVNGNFCNYNNFQTGMILSQRKTQKQYSDTITKMFIIYGFSHMKYILGSDGISGPWESYHGISDNHSDANHINIPEGYFPRKITLL